MKTKKVLCIHGIGGKDALMNDNTGWVKDWREALISHLSLANDQDVQFMPFDSFFKPYDETATDYLRFLSQSFLGLWGDRRRQKGLVKDWMDNYPDMVVEFFQYPDLRLKLRNELKKYITILKPDVIYSHSLGSLLCYDYFSHPENQKGHENIILVTAGSQLGNPGLKYHLPYPIVRLPLNKWYNLNNSYDNVFARHDISVKFDNFMQIETLFDDKGDPMNHNGLSYLNNEHAISKVWKQI